MSRITHLSDPLNPGEWQSLLQTARAAGNATVARRILTQTEPLGAGAQTVPTETFVGITEGYKKKGSAEQAIRVSDRKSGIVPLIFKDFVIHWRDLAESRTMSQALSGLLCAQRGQASSIRPRAFRLSRANDRRR
jgi:uncharacterized linocin/CFP29 family protein